MRSEKYSYGQGAVFLAKRLADGSAGPYRWVGDVSEMSIALSTEEFTHKESYSGKRLEVRKIVTGKSGELSLKFHEMSKENLSLLLQGEAQVIKGSTVTGEALPAEIKAGDRIALAHQNVSAVTIGTLVLNQDYTVDDTFGVIEFLVDKKNNKETVNYTYGDVENVSFLNSDPEDLMLRFEGINLAEQNEWNLVELYKLNFNPTEALSLINNENALDALTAKAKILADTSKTGDSVLGRFGRTVKITK